MSNRIFRFSEFLVATALVLVTNTAGASEPECTVTFRLDQPVVAGSLQFGIDYSPGDVQILGSGGGVQCERVDAGAFGSMHDDDAGHLEVALIHLGGMSGPCDLIRCYVTGDGGVSAADFDIYVSDAASPTLDPIAPFPAVVVSDVDCGGVTTTTTSTSSTSSTSIPWGSTTSTTLDHGGGETECEIDFELVDDVNVGSLQFTVGYEHTWGNFVGSDDEVLCERRAGEFGTFHDDEENVVLNTAIISMEGFSGPRVVTTCAFTSYDGMPWAEDFEITVVDASEPDVTPIDPLPAVVIGDMRCVTDTSTTTTVDDTTTTSTSTSTSTTTSTTTTTVPVCGDGVVQKNEQCDEGDGNSNSAADACRSDCTRPVCGDGVVDSGEECDSGANNASGVADACRADCTAPVCGDGIVDSGEQCDEGRGNSNDRANACREDCSAPVCGDGVVDSGEECDDGEGNSDTESGACRSDCTEPVCGDGVVDEGEECDDGAANSDANPGGCRKTCVRDAVCGDVDASGSITVIDSLQVLKSAIGLSGYCPLSTCDADASGNVTVMDSLRVLKKAIGLESELICSMGMTIAVEDQVTLGSLMLEIDYSATGDTFSGEGDDVDCSLLIGGALGAFNNNTEEGKLTVGIVSSSGVSGPADLAICRFRPHDEKPSASDIVVSVVEATDPVGGDVGSPNITVEF